jgi:hypothetical protein
MHKRIIIALLYFSTVSFAQPKDNGNWLMYFGNNATNSKFNWHNEVQYRNYNFVGDIEQLLLRTGIGYNITPNNNNVLLGYGFIYTEKYISETEKSNNSEHRLFQQYISKYAVKRVFFQNRYRIEERFLKNNFKLRLRYFWAINIPLNKTTMEKGAVYLSAYNEVFLNTQSAVFDRNRVYGALGYVLGKNIKLEIGYMSQLYEKTNRNQFQVAIFNNLPFYKSDF